MRKKILSIILSMIIPAFGISAEASIIYQNDTHVVISKGVVQTTIQRFTTNGWYKIHVAKIDLNENFLALKTLTSESGVNTRENVVAIAKQTDALAAVNADFFQPSGSMPTKASAIGVVVDDGKMLTTPARGKAMATFAIDNNNEVTMGLWDQYINLIAPNGEVKQIIHVNKYFDEGGLVIFNSDWDAYSPGRPLTNMEMVVEDDVVTDIRWQGDGVKFPENGYVIASTSGTDTFLADNFQIGDNVRVESWLEPNPANYKMAVGGGTLLLKDGADAPVTHNISGTNPRTAMGVNKEGNIVYLVTIDGRQHASVGMSMNELRNFMRDIGCHNAINLDGGGSTTFVSKEPRESEVTLKNVVSDGSMRRVANAVGVVSSAPIGEPAILDIFSSDKRIYSESENRFNVNVYDEYYHTLDVPKNEIVLTVSGVDGYFADNVLYASSAGTATVTATYKTLSNSIDIYVRPAKQEPDTDNLRLADDVETEGTKIAVMGSTNYSTLIGKLYAYRSMKLVNEAADTIVILDRVKSDVIERAEQPLISGGYYYAAYKQNNIIIQLDNRIDGLQKSDNRQWQRFLEQLENITVKNVIITLSQPPTSQGFSDGLELNLFKQMLEEKLVDKGKNVFVIYDDASNSVKIENGIRYFGLKGIKDIKASSYTSLLDCKYLLITSNGDEVSYQMKNILF